MEAMKQDDAKPWYRVRCVATALVFLLCIPLSFMYMIVRIIAASLSKKEMPGKIPVTDNSKTVLLTGAHMAKSLMCARYFWRAGYKVVLVTTHYYAMSGARWSKAVTKFATVTSPLTDSDKYVEELVILAIENKVDYFVPVTPPSVSVHASRAKPLLEEIGCKVLHFDEEMTEILDNKHEFCTFMHNLGINAPLSYGVTSDQEVMDLNENFSTGRDGKTYILKNITYDNAHRLDMFKLPCKGDELVTYLKKIRDDGNPITPAGPWQVQQFINGEEYSCMVVVRDGHIRAITTCLSSPSQLNYQHVNVPAITDWVRQFAEKTAQLTGNLCFDFIQDYESQVIYPLECNPRMHSQIAVFRDIPELGQTILSDTCNKAYTLEPDEAASKLQIYWFYNEVFKLLPSTLFPGYRQRSVNNLKDYLLLARDFLQLILDGEDNDFDIEDPLPFIMRNHIQMPLLLIKTFLKNQAWYKLDINIGKVVEMGGSYNL